MLAYNSNLMNILVPIKQVPDTGMNLRLTDGVIDETGLKWVLSPYDEFAIEESLKLKTQLKGKLFAVTLGPTRSREALLTALALGVDEAFHLVIDKFPQDPLTTAQILKKKIEEIPNLSLIFCGKLSTDSNNFAVPQMLAGLLDFPFVTNINNLQYKEGNFYLTRECGGGVEEVLKAKAPLILSADKGLNEPRYPSLPGIMKAKKKPLHTVSIPNQNEKIKLIKLNPPSEKKATYIIKGTSEEQVKELVQILREKEKLL